MKAETKPSPKPVAKMKKLLSTQKEQKVEGSTKEDLTKHHSASDVRDHDNSKRLFDRTPGGNFSIFRDMVEQGGRGADINWIFGLRSPGRPFSSYKKYRNLT
jgi:hypothetical protein